MTGLWLPAQTFDLVQMSEGQAILVVGLLALLALLGVQLRNPAALVSLAMTIVLLVLSAILGLGSEFLWLGVITTALLVLIGAAVRWTK